MHLTCQLQQLSPNGKGREKEKEKRGHSAERRRKVDQGASYLDTEFLVVEFLGGIDGDIIIVYLEDVFDHLCVLLWRVSSIDYTFSSSSNFGFISADHFLFQTFFHFEIGRASCRERVLMSV